MKKIRFRFIFYNMLALAGALAIVGFFVTVNDRVITDTIVKRMEMAVFFSFVLVFITSYLLSNQAINPIKRAWKRQVDFTADASHELRTPLAIITTNLEIVTDNKDETVESQMKWLNNIQQETIRMNRLIEDLLTLSRADAMYEVLECTYFYLDQVVLEVKERFEQKAADNHIQISVDTASHIVFWGDKNRILQLLTILVDNAIKYMSRPGNIDIRLEEKDRKVTVIVMDNGQGIEKENLEHIFERFYRVEKARSSKKGGYGLGLPIAKTIVEKHRGNIHVTSKAGQGTAFTMQFSKDKWKAAKSTSDK